MTACLRLQGGWSLWNNTEGGKGADAQGKWLEQDLAAADANRANVPWVIVTSHFPLVNTMLAQNKHKSAEHYIGIVRALCLVLWGVLGPQQICERQMKHPPTRTIQNTLGPF